MVNGDDQGLAGRCILQFGLEPVDLRLAELAAFGAIAGQANKRGERRFERPVNIRLSHRVPGRVLRLRSDDRNL